MPDFANSWFPGSSIFRVKMKVGNVAKTKDFFAKDEDGKKAVEEARAYFKEKYPGATIVRRIRVDKVASPQQARGCWEQARKERQLLLAL